MTPRQARLGVDVFTALVIASVGLALAGLTWRLAGYSGAAPATAPVIASGSRGADIKPLIALAPFGAAAATGASEGDGPIRLRAIFMAVPAQASTVLIAGADGKVASYGLGAAVGGGVIEAIGAEQIVLRLPGGPRTIGFAPDGVSAPGGSVTAGAVAGSAPTAPRSGASPALSGADAVRSLIPPALQGRNAPAPPGAPAIASAPPARSGPGSGGGAGYVVGAAPGAAVLAAGIRPGDVIERVNGRAVNAGTSERDLIAQAAASGAARVELLRDGRRISLTVPVR